MSVTCNDYGQVDLTTSGEPNRGECLRIDGGRVSTVAMESYSDAFCWSLLCCVGVD